MIHPPFHPRRSQRRHHDGGRGCARSHSSRSTISRAASPQHARRVRDSAAACIPFSGDQHVLAQRRQMTAADWTAIGRRLATRRSARRPPKSSRKSGHLAIVPPLTASSDTTRPPQDPLGGSSSSLLRPSSRRAKPVVAAAVAVGVGVAAALAKAELQRRSARKQPAVSRSELKRITLQQLDLAIALLEGRGEVNAERTVHETRKALKRTRALVRLQQSALGASLPARQRRAAPGLTTACRRARRRSHSRHAAGPHREPPQAACSQCRRGPAACPPAR